MVDSINRSCILQRLAAFHVSRLLIVPKIHSMHATIVRTTDTKYWWNTRGRAFVSLLATHTPRINTRADVATRSMYKDESPRQIATSWIPRNNICRR